MQVQKQWAKPELTSYGSVEQITEQVQVNVQKQIGTNDSLILTITNNASITINDDNNGPVANIEIIS